MQVVHVEMKPDHHTLVFTVKTSAGVRVVPITTCSLEAANKFTYGQLLFWTWMLYGKTLPQEHAEAR